MSDITPNERHEVAERLRFYADCFDFGDSNPYWYVQKAVFDDTQIHKTHKLFARLADLIDPTCHCIEDLEPDGIGAPPRYTSRCSICGLVWDGTTGHGYSPEYCPYCGSRVVQD